MSSWVTNELHCILLSYTLRRTERPCTLRSFTGSFFVHPLSYAAPAFYWALTHPTELHCTLVSYDAACWATLFHPTELCCTLLNYAAPSEQCCTLLSSGALYWATTVQYWATQYPTELRWTLLSYAEPYWATLNPTELRCTLLSYAVHYWATQHHENYATA